MLGSANTPLQILVVVPRGNIASEAQSCEPWSYFCQPVDTSPLFNIYVVDSLTVSPQVTAPVTLPERSFPPDRHTQPSWSLSTSQHSGAVLRCCSKQQSRSQRAESAAAKSARKGTVFEPRLVRNSVGNICVRWQVFPCPVHVRMTAEGPKYWFQGLQICFMSRQICTPEIRIRGTN